QMVIKSRVHQQLHYLFGDKPESAKQMMSKLKAHFEGDDTIRAVDFFQRFRNLILNPPDDICAFTSEWVTVANGLAQIQLSDDTFRALHYLGSLPKEYDLHVAVLRGRKDLSFEEAHSYIMREARSTSGEATLATI